MTKYEFIVDMHEILMLEDEKGMFFIDMANRAIVLASDTEEAVDLFESYGLKDKLLELLEQ